LMDLLRRRDVSRPGQASPRSRLCRGTCPQCSSPAGPLRLSREHGSQHEHEDWQPHQQGTESGQVPDTGRLVLFTQRKTALPSHLGQAARAVEAPVNPPRAPLAEEVSAAVAGGSNRNRWVLGAEPSDPGREGDGSCAGSVKSAVPGMGDLEAPLTPRTAIVSRSLEGQPGPAAMAPPIGLAWSIHRMWAETGRSGGCDACGPADRVLPYWKTAIRIRMPALPGLAP